MTNLLIFFCSPLSTSPSFFCFSFFRVLSSNTLLNPSLPIILMTFLFRRTIYHSYFARLILISSSDGCDRNFYISQSLSRAAIISGLPSDFFLISFYLLISFWFTVTSFLLAHTLQVRICISLYLRECYCSWESFFFFILSRCCCINSYLAYHLSTFCSILNFSLPLNL